MADNKKDQKRSNKPETNESANPMPKNYSNAANHKGAVDLGTEGTKATATQQQGQGEWRAKDHNNRTGSDSGSGQGGQGGRSQTGK